MATPHFPPNLPNLDQPLHIKTVVSTTSKPTPNPSTLLDQNPNPPNNPDITQTFNTQNHHPSHAINNQSRPLWNYNSAIPAERYFSFFVEFILNEWSPNDLYWKIHPWEKVVDVFIANKRSHRGVRFGFARFVKNPKGEDSRLLKLNDKVKGNGNMRFSLAKYARVKTSLKRKTLSLAGSDRSKEEVAKRPSKMPWKLRDSRSYATAVTSTKTCSFPQEETVRVEVKVNSEWNSWMHHSAIGTAGRGCILKKYFTRKARIVFVGGDSYMAVFHKLAKFEAEALFGFPSLSPFLCNVHPWCKEDGAFRSWYWLNVYGIPLHAWHEDTFKAVVEPFGRMVHVLPQSRKPDRVDFARCNLLDM